jgi:hypothetical protein
VLFRTVFACSTALAISGCGHPVERKLEGHWLGEGVENFEGTELAAATGWAKGTSFEFSGSNLTVTIPAEEPRSGKYRVTKAHDADVTLAIEGPDKKVSPIRLKFDNEYSMRWMVDDLRSVLLRRER